ncbi:MAG: DNA cytosine methyltransferase [Corynebacterium sp.]|uniref:DNA cytosine methyltransferase n=1 Tax=Corynebacterium sp. TaxID=1720 RepID=UPI0026DDC651|nr:DNA cytosine methyltransferase [Corynebacterium sp.]MDO5098195.1 DNA cytosine methyltransferase [Corynebacterium sp.]
MVTVYGEAAPLECDRLVGASQHVGGLIPDVAMKTHQQRWLKEVADLCEESKNRRTGFQSAGLVPVIDVFSGCGAFSLGFRLVGVPVVVGIADTEPAARTFALNVFSPALACGAMSRGEILDAIAPLCPKGAGIIAQLPHQKNTSVLPMLEEILRTIAAVANQTKASFVLIESRMFTYQTVEALLSFEQYCNTTMSSDIIRYIVADYGVAEYDERVAYIAAPHEEFPSAVGQYFHQLRSPQRVSVDDWFGPELGTDFIYRHARNYRRKAIFSTTTPAPRQLGWNHMLPMNYPGNADDAAPGFLARSLTTPERASVLTFPPGFTFMGSAKYNEKMIGESIPPKVAVAFARSVTRALTYL